MAVTVAGYGGLVWIALAPPLALWAKIPWFRTTMVTAGCVWTSDLLATGLKAAVAHFGGDSEWRNVRPPLTPIDNTVERELLAALEAASFTMPNL